MRTESRISFSHSLGHDLEYRVYGHAGQPRGEIPATFDYWGHDVDHDWPRWRRMLPYQLERLGV